ncbi:MAG: 4-(cytidine 5'-diphospho)-2-C-methyl-D-erythritol kinase [Bacteroidaceae bacterium]|nr:4-(cytidine 5'-diphospho)-2-C-methyl-D-erythritol kinase [Bacteroidaceae bacterium]
MLYFPISKINLGLYITEKRIDGYHNLETIFYPIPLHDNLEIEISKHDDKPYQLFSSGNKIEGAANDNIIIKVLNALKRDYTIPSLDIHLHKRIPMGAGLGGGSSDAATFMKALNEMFDLKMSTSEMEERLAPIGADCPFFVKSEPCFASGIGNVFSPITLSLKGYYLVLVKPQDFVSTKDAYSGVVPQKANIDLREIDKLPIAEWRLHVRNMFEVSVFKKFPNIAAVKETLYDMGAIYASMSGSGSTVFAIFDRKVEGLEKVFSDCFTFQEQFRA